MSEQVAGAPRRTVRPDPLERINERLAATERAVHELQRAAPTRNSSVSGGEGFRVYDDDGARRVQLSPDGTVTAYGAGDKPVVRMGVMVETVGNAGASPYGIEVLVNGTWLQYGVTSVAWNDIGGKPTAFPATADSSVGYAATAGTAGEASKADGPTSAAFNRDLAGRAGSMYAMWMHSDGMFGRNTSSIRYKENVQPHDLDPAAVLKLQSVTYDRKSADGDSEPASRGEFGLIAEEVLKVVPELVVWFEGEVDSVRYDLVAVALLSVVKDQAARLDALESGQGRIVKALAEMGIEL